MLITYTLIIVPTILFLINVAAVVSIVMFILACITTTVVLIMFSITACSDPGVIFLAPQPSHDVAARDSTDPTLTNLENGLSSAPQTVPEHSAESGIARVCPGGVEGDGVAEGYDGLSRASSSSVASNDGYPLNRTSFERDKSGLQHGSHSSQVMPSPSSSSSINPDTFVSVNEPPSPQVLYIQCGMCKLDRPRTASHCYQCGVCIDEVGPSERVSVFG